MKLCNLVLYYSFFNNFPSFVFQERIKLSEEEERQVEVKASSLFSLLVPVPFSGPVWTTVILLVGWRLFMRNR